MFGKERGPRLVDFVGRTADVVWELIDKHGMDVPNTRTGWIQSAISNAAVGPIESRAAQWQKRGAPVEVLDRRRDGAACRPRPVSRFLDRSPRRRGATARLCARPCQGRHRGRRGGPWQHAGHGLAREGGKWIVRTAQGARVTADRVVLATNGYTGDLWPQLRQTIIAANSFQIATKPLSDNVRKSILPGGQATSDSRRIGLYYRLDHTGRFLLGGRGTMREPRHADDWSTSRR